MGFIRETGNAARGMWSLAVGLKVTGKYFLSPQITCHYPREVLPNMDTFRGHIELIAKPSNPAKSKCIACGSCARACPSGCITVIKKKAEPAPAPEAAGQQDESIPAGQKKKPPKKTAPKEPSLFALDFTTCSLCGQCVQVCPVSALRFSSAINLAGYTREEFHYDLLQRLAEQAEK
ncbi:MAG TPA: 4Fe-4S binding protein [Desulfomicrobiaceae bacterium]|nr:4Fe-4S binding protein [Desulfomicrobiaceae bacterium]